MLLFIYGFMLYECSFFIYSLRDWHVSINCMDYKGVSYMYVVNLLLNVLIILFVGMIMQYNYSSLKKEHNLLQKNVDELQTKLLSYNSSDVFEKCNETLCEFNEIMFGSPPLKNKVVIVRSIKEYDYTTYKKDINSLNDDLKNGWSVVSHDTNEFVHTYLLGRPLVWNEEKEGDINVK